MNDTQYCYQFRVKDGADNISNWSTEACAVTDVVPDTEAPYWNAGNHADVSNGTVWPTSPEYTIISTFNVPVTMTCAVATDDVGTVWYRFERTGGPSTGVNSGWQISNTWAENIGASNISGLAYTVKISDRGDGLGNERVADEIFAVPAP